MKVTILDGFSVTQNDLDWHQLSETPNLEVNIFDRTPATLTTARCQDAEAVLTNKVVFTAETLAQLPRLRYIGVLATGYNVVDTLEAHRRGIVVTNIPAYSTPSVVQLTMAHLLNATNSVAHYAHENQKGRWSQSPDFLWMDTPVTELSGKTMVIRGMGNIGTGVARVAQALGMHVVAVTGRTDLPEGVSRMSWAEALSQADVLSLHCPLTPDTHHIINAQSLSQMKSTAILINTGRGPLVDETAVSQALHKGQLGAYCADVLSEEPPQPSNPLLTAPRCYLTPHIAWASREARKRLITTAVDNLQAFVDGHPVNTV